MREQVEKIEQLIDRFTVDIKELVDVLGPDAFMSGIEVKIQNIPLDVFQVISEHQDVSVKSYDVSEGIPCLEFRQRVGTWGYIYLSSNPIREKSDDEPAS